MELDETTVTKKAYNIGDVIKPQDNWDPRYTDWVVGPRSPKTGIIMLLEPTSDVLEDDYYKSGHKTWYQGEDHSEELREQGYANARQPSADDDNDELSAIYNKVVKAGRNSNAKLITSGPVRYVHHGRYWSGSSQSDIHEGARIQCFNNGWTFDGYKDIDLAHVRCVCDAPKGLKLNPL